MSTYRYETDNDSIDIREGAAGTNVFIWVHEGRKEAAILIPKTDAPTVAAELLKAAGQESVIVPKAYEEVEQLGDEITCGSGPEAAHASMAMNPNWLRNGAANMVALAEYIESAAAREAAATAEAEAVMKKLQERRDGVIARLCPEAARVNSLPVWDELSLLDQRAINHILNLEDGASRD